MKIFCNKHSAFTMIEIAIALAVIAFALVAIIGVLPTGLTVQKDNREETIMNQDGPYWLEAIRNGSQGLDHLTNYVISIMVSNNLSQTNIYTNAPLLGISPPFDGSMTNGKRIIGLLSSPKYTVLNNKPMTNWIFARVRALTGSATEQGQSNPDFAFSYLLVPEVTPFVASQVPPASTNFNDPNIATNAAEIALRKMNWTQVQSREANSSEVRLTFKWPLLPNDQTGPNRQSVRALVSGTRTNIDGLDYFQPQTFSAVRAP